MFVPEKLYQFTAKDIGGYPLIDPFFRASSNGSAVASQSTTIALTDIGDRFLFLQSVVGEANAGAAQTATYIAIELLAPTTDNTPGSYRLSQKIASGLNDFLAWSGSILVPPSWRIRARSEFTAGAAVNTAQLHLIGALVPRGSIQRL